MFADQAGRPLPEKIEVQTCKLMVRPCNRSVTLLWPAARSTGPHFRSPFSRLCRRERVGDVIAGLRLAANLLKRRARCQLDQGHSPTAPLIDSKYPKIGDHHIDHAGSRER